MELKHLAPYLPYELNGVDSIYPELHFKLIGFESLKPTWEYIGDKSQVANRWNCKPLLRPLSDLTNGDLTPYAIIKTSEGEPIFIGDNGKMTVEGLPYSVFQKLLEQHFDVFGLIEKGEAIPKT